MILLMLFHLGLASAFADVVCECENVQCGRCEQATQIVFYTTTCQTPQTCAKPQCEKQNCNRALVEPVVVGSLTQVEGETTIYRLASGQVTKLKVAREGLRLYATDVVEVQTGRAQLRLADQSELLAVASTRIEVRQLTTKEIKLALSYGQIRAKMKSPFEVNTPGGVLRSSAPQTETVVSYRDFKFAASAIDGDLEMTPARSDRALKIKSTQEVSYTLVGSTGEGWFSTVHDISVDLPSFSVAERAPASVEAHGLSSICSEPIGKLDQCAWSCEGNPKGSKKCRLDKPDVFCVRRRCNANGQWADESRLSLKAALQRCQSPTVQVGICDY